MVRHDFHQFDRRSTLFEHYLDGGQQLLENQPTQHISIKNFSIEFRNFSQNNSNLCSSAESSSNILEQRALPWHLTHLCGKNCALTSHYECNPYMNAPWRCSLYGFVNYIVFFFCLGLWSAIRIALGGCSLLSYCFFFYDNDDDDDDIWKHLDVVSYQQESLFPENCLLTSAVEKILFKGKTDD